MKRFSLFISILIGCIVWACDSQPIPSQVSNTIGNIQSRGIITSTSLPIGSEALFNASGGLSLANLIFTFNGTKWGNSEEELTFETGKETSITAIYPAKNDENTLITQSPYVENTLEDILIAQHTFSEQTNIELEFKHLFAMLTIQVASSVNATLTEIAVEAPKVSSINGINGTFKTSNENTHTTTLVNSASGVYSFIIPSIDDCPLRIIFNPGENEISHSLTHHFKSGFKYECNVVEADKRPGIRTADDLIDFSKFINGDLPKEEWSRFGYIEGTDTIYCLLNDIKFEDKQLIPIGNDFSKPFAAIFDGKGHTITELKLSPFNGVTGLFGRITPSGVIKNLHLDNISSPTINESSSSGVGALSGVCYGTIDNCSITNSNLTVDQTYPTGGMVGYLHAKGYIINSFVQNIDITSNGYAGGIVGETAGQILNCYAYNNAFKTKSSSLSGGIAGQSNNGQIHNCYIYQSKEPKYWGAVIGKNNYITLRNFLYNGSTYVVYDHAQPTSSNAQIYDTSFQVNGTHISSILNDWVNQQNKNSAVYPNMTFKTWTSIDNNSPAIFQQ